MSGAQASRTPRHLWIVGIVALLWNLLGAMDYLTLQRNRHRSLRGGSPVPVG
jgi:hypothetical protein